VPITAIQKSPYSYEIPITYQTGMRVPGVIFASQELMDKAIEDRAVEQVANVACLPGIVKASMAMPDIHWGYGFPIGGVAATDVNSGVISPGGVGFDISCGVRLMRSNFTVKELGARIPQIVHQLSRNIPKGLGRHGKIKLDFSQMDKVLLRGAAWAVENGYGQPEDLEVIEHGGTYKNADPELVSRRAKERGLSELGTVGSGNHFVELQEVVEVFDASVAEAFGLFDGQLVIMIHSGSRGVGHQVCTDYLKEMDKVTNKLGIVLPDRQLACAPLTTNEGKRYLAAMAAAANYGLANRQCIAYWVRYSFQPLFGQSYSKMGLELVYDVSHNVAQIEEHKVDGVQRQLCVHRKGATRSFAPGHLGVCKKYRSVGQPVMIPGDMGRASYVLCGTKESMELAFGSTCHGAGRLMSRKRARKEMSGSELSKKLLEEGIVIEAGSTKLLSEEAPYAYKNVSKVVDVCERAGLSKKVCKMKPLGVLKG
jgi:tRNA-splicing ligase RtcB